MVSGSLPHLTQGKTHRVMGSLSVNPSDIDIKGADTVEIYGFNYIGLGR